LFAEDFARVITQIISDGQEYPKSIIVSPGTSITIRQLAVMIADIMEFKGKIIFDASKLEGIKRKNTNNFLFKTNFSNFEFTDIKKSLEKTI
jgi:nucleoside-diphosphate-sugar epimerase